MQSFKGAGTRLLADGTGVLFVGVKGADVLAHTSKLVEALLAMGTRELSSHGIRVSSHVLLARLRTLELYFAEDTVVLLGLIGRRPVAGGSLTVRGKGPQAGKSGRLTCVL